MAECGSPAGYMAHRRAGEKICLKCKGAWREYYAELKRKKMKHGTTSTD